MSYDKTSDLKSIQADVLTTNTTDNDLISSLKQLKTDNKSITKAINALNEQLGNAQVSAADAVQRVVVLEQEVDDLQVQLSTAQANAAAAEGRVVELEQTIAELQTQLANAGSGGSGEVVDRAKHVMGMLLLQESNGTGTFLRINRDRETIPFDAEHGTWAGMKTVVNDTYGEFVEIPVTYVKTETLTDSPYAGKNVWWTADGPEEGFHVHPAFMGADGQPHPLQISAWLASNKNNVPFSADKGSGSSGYWTGLTYNEIHAKGWMADCVRPYSIYDHHFLARLMLTEFGTPNMQAQTVNGVAWIGSNRISYHGMHDLFGLPDYNEYYWLNGLTTLNGTYHLLATDGSRSMVDTGVACLTSGTWPVNCRVGQANGVDFGDVFLADRVNENENSGSFSDYQYCRSGRVFATYWSNDASARGAFFLADGDPNSPSGKIGWRTARCC